MDIEQKIEAILFFKGEPVTLKTLSKLLSVPLEKIQEEVGKLSLSLAHRGICVLLHNDTVSLGTAPNQSDLITAIRKIELSKDIGKAGLETLSIILYKGPVARSEIDYIRGVNSSFIIRNLLIRNLILRTTNPNDSRSYVYTPTLELLSFLGVTRVHDLPQYEQVILELKSFIKEKEEEQTSFEDNISIDT